MLRYLKNLMAPELPSAIHEAERDLRLAECEHLKVMEKLEYYLNMAEYKAMHISRLREVIRTNDVLAGLEVQDEQNNCVMH